jgi:NAD(P)-dependent dehydrogenase (short-subunit alcohol dehydrogenase family)
MQIEGSVALVTGAERGLGRALVLGLARGGARVVASGLARESLEALRVDIVAAGGQARAVPCDVTDPAQIATLTAEAAREFGGIDLLVNNAGITLGGDISLISDDAWNRVLEVNLRGAVRMVDAVLPGMLARGRGYIVNIASAAGLAAPALWIPYATSKFALVGFSEGLRAALRPRGLGVSVACPMWIRTDMLRGGLPRLVDAPVGVQSVNSPGRAWAWLVSRARGKDMSPATAARRIIRGIERERFLIYTHRSTRLFVAARALAPELFARLWDRVNALDELRHRTTTLP